MFLFENCNCENLKQVDSETLECCECDKLFDLEGNELEHLNTLQGCPEGFVEAFEDDYEI